MFATQLEAQLSAGDVFRQDWDSDRADSIGPVVVFSHDCDIDKNPAPLVAKIVADANTPSGLLGDIKRGRVWHALYLEGCAEPGWVNLRTIQPVARDLLLGRLDRRLHSMTPDGRLALAAKFFQFLARTLPPTSTT